MSGIAPRSCLRSAGRRGFTLVELLVVITIIGILMALLLPVLGRAREFAHRVSCMDNQRNIGQAMNQYALSKGHMPPELTWYQDASGTFILGWAENLMGYLGRNDLSPGTLPVATLRGLTPGVPIPSVAVLVCPSDSNKSGVGGGAMSYVVNGGCPNSSNPAASPTQQPVDANANGAWNYSGGTTNPASPPTTLAAYQSGLGYNTNISLEYIAKHDGSSTTISHSENLDATNYTFGQASYNSSSSQQTESSQAILWYPGQTGTSTAGLPINYNPNGSGFPSGSINQTSNSYGASAAGFTAIARPSSNHPGGAVFTFCDGSVKFIQSSMAYNVYASLMTSYGAQATQPGVVFTSTGNTYLGLQIVALDASQIPSN
jgi:prepilin-type N-terminal cleavage/methylation domain-containing protein/prepilin-type processing-associated H-X9-DG protein